MEHQSMSDQYRFYSINDIAVDFANSLSPEDRQFVLSGKQDFGMIGRHIRNEYGLWHSNHLTERWRLVPESRVIENGVDMSPNHPDAVAATIQQRVKEILKEMEHESDKQNN